MSQLGAFAKTRLPHGRNRPSTGSWRPIVKEPDTGTIDYVATDGAGNLAMHGDHQSCRHLRPNQPAHEPRAGEIHLRAHLPKLKGGRANDGFRRYLAVGAHTRE
jgi:hypothetical protein